MGKYYDHIWRVVHGLLRSQACRTLWNHGVVLVANKPECAHTVDDAQERSDQLCRQARGYSPPRSTASAPAASNTRADGNAESHTKVPTPHRPGLCEETGWRLCFLVIFCAKRWRLAHWQNGPTAAQRPRRAPRAAVRAA